jgi:hypothetical protein
LVSYLGLPDKKFDKDNAVQVADCIEQLVCDLGLGSTLTQYNVANTEQEMEAITERALGTREGDEFKAVVEIVRSLY